MKKISIIEKESYRYPNNEKMYNTDTKATDATHSAIGFTISGKPYGLVLSEAPNVLIYGTKESGKTEVLKTMLLSMTTHATPQELEIHIVSPNSDEYSEYELLPHMKSNLINSKKELEQFVSSLDSEVGLRSAKVGESLSKSSIQYNKYINYDLDSYIPQTVVAIDRFEDIIEQYPSIAKEILKLASYGKRVGLHFIITAEFLANDDDFDGLLDTFQSRVITGERPSVFSENGKLSKLLNLPKRTGTSVVSHKGSIDVVEVEMIDYKDRVDTIRNISDKFKLERDDDKHIPSYRIVRSNDRFKNILKELF